MFLLRMARLGVSMIAAFALPVIPASADGLIWEPAKIGRNAYDLRVGAALSVPLELRGGAKFSISANEAGRLNTPGRPLNFWGTLATPASRSGAVERRRGEMNVDFNTMSGGTYVQLKSTRTHMLTPAADIETSQAIAATANVYRSSRDVLDATVGTRLVLRDTKTSFAANGVVRSNREGPLGSFVIEQRLTPHLRLNATFARTDNGSRRSLGARYSIFW